MNGGGFSLFPPAASTQAVATDRIFDLLLVIGIAIALLVVVLVTLFAVRFRRGSSAPRGELPALISREVELGWTAATFFLALFLFWWAASARLSALAPPEGALEVHVVAKQWMWKAQHPNGAREIDELHVPLGEPVRLVMTAQDVIHSFYVPAFRIKQDVLPGRATETWFEPTEAGEFHLLCAEFCGTDHARMIGRIVVMQPEDYARWAAAQPQADDLAKEGEALFRSLGCSGCHAPASAVHAPDLHGVYGAPVPLADGRVALADEAYLRDSILMPKRDVAAGYQPIMPSFEGVIGEDELVRLVAYVKSLATDREGRR